MADPMRWSFSDGTAVELGGRIDGASTFADELRAVLARGATVQVWAHPTAPHALDATDPALLDAWLRQELDLWTRIDGNELTLTAPEGVPPLPPPPWAGQPDVPGRVY